ncbi:MAG: hypothetical protein ACFFBD_08255, partial [Candidatus Hodarchaeota archaeon]
EGSLLIQDIEYITGNLTALDKYHIFLALFKVWCPESQKNVSKIDLWGQIDSTTRNFTTQLPDIGFSDQNDVYQIWKSLTNLELDEYKVSIYTNTSIANNTYIGDFIFEIVETLEPPSSLLPFELIPAVGIILANILVIYLNFRQHRRGVQKRTE